MHRNDALFQTLMQTKGQTLEWPSLPENGKRGQKVNTGANETRDGPDGAGDDQVPKS